MKDRCSFFEVLRIISGRAVRGEGQFVRPTFKKKACCMHPQSKHRIDTISPSATCKGNPKKYDISPICMELTQGVN